MSVFLQPGAKQKIWWYRFMHRGTVIRRSTKQGSHKTAKEMEAAHKSSLAKGDVGIFEKEQAPTLAQFAREFLVWAQTNFREKPKTLSFYSNGIRRLLEFQPLASLALDDKRIGERLVGYIAKRQAQELQVSSINRELQCLRRLLHLAIEWGRIESAVTVRMLHGEQHRELVVSPAEESRYLAAAPPLLNSIATMLFDTGLRPEECSRLRWEDLSWINGRHGTLLVTHGKTKAARRMLPLSVRVRKVLETRWEAAQRPAEGWVWDAPTKSGHIEPSSLKKQHARALRLSKVRPFVLYSLRHTFLTRLGESGCDVWTLARIAGHSSIAISSRYVHPSSDAVLAAMEGRRSQEFGHSAEMTISTAVEEKLLSA